MANSMNNPIFDRLLSRLAKRPVLMRKWGCAQVQSCARNREKTSSSTLGECDIVQVEPDDEVSTALAVCGDRLAHISLCHERLKERLHNAYRIDLKGESQRKRNKPPPLDGGNDK